MRYKPNWQYVVWPLFVAAILRGCIFCPPTPTTTCEERGDCPREKRYPAPVSPDSVLAAFELAYIDKNFDEYQKLFDHAIFEFAFAQVDIDQNPDLPPTWGWGPERESTESLFGSDIVYNVRCNLSARDAPEPATDADQLENLSPADLPNTKKVRIREARVEIDTTEEGGGPLTLQVDGDAQEFFIKVYPGELTDTGLPVHRIVYWKDKAIASGGGGGGLAVDASMRSATSGQIRLRFGK